MTDRGLPIVDGAPACPFVAFEDERDERSTRPDHRHRCFAEPRPAARALAHQDAYCLSSAFPACPTFQDWARREAATARPPLRSDRPDEAPPIRRRRRHDWAAPPPWVAGSGSASSTDADEDADVAPGLPATGRGAAAASSLDFLATARSRSADATMRPSEAPGSRHRADHDEDADVDSDEGADTERSDPRWARPVASRDAGASAPAGATAPAEAPARAARATAATGLAASAAAWLGDDDPDEAPHGFGDVRDRFERDADLDEDDDAADDPDEPLARPGRVPRRAIGASAASAAARHADDRRPSRTLRGPEWEEPYRHEAYPTLRTRVGMPSLSRVAVGFIALILAALVLFFVPPMLLKLGAGSGGDAAATVAPSVSPSPSVELSPTPVPQPTELVYTVTAGDTLSSIAKKLKVSLAELIAANPQLKDPNKLAIGDQLKIPTPASTSVTDASAAPIATTVPDASPSTP